MNGCITVFPDLSFGHFSDDRVDVLSSVAGDRNDWNLLLYGFGSKIGILEEFIAKVRGVLPSGASLQPSPR